MNSLRPKIIAVFLLVLVLPQLVVMLWLGIENRMATAMRKNSRFAAEQAVGVLRKPAAGPISTAKVLGLLDYKGSSAVEAIAKLHRVRLRVVDGSGHAVLDLDHDRASDFSQQLGHWLLGAGFVSPREFDLTAPPLGERPEIVAARNGANSDGCRNSHDAELVLCHGAVGFEWEGKRAVMYAQDGSSRPILTLYDLRSQLGRLLLASLPFALICALWMGRRIARPLEELSKQALAKSLESRARADLTVQGDTEMKTLAQAVNTLIEKLEERRSANEELVADLVHELKNPVATVRACAEALSSDGHSESVRRMAQLIDGASLRLDGLISELLEIARADAGMQRESREAVDLAPLVSGIVDVMRECGRFLGVRFELALTPSLPVFGVPSRIESVVRNLLENAASFAGSGGVVSARLERQGESVVFVVHDTGPGISPEDMPHVFNRFFSTRGGQRGTGLGLALTRALVEAHGGTIEAASAPGQGTTLRVRLPIHTVFTP